jgi:hypothetical protein
MFETGTKSMSLKKFMMLPRFSEVAKITPIRIRKHPADTAPMMTGSRRVDRLLIVSPNFHTLNSLFVVCMHIIVGVHLNTYFADMRNGKIGEENGILSKVWKQD